MHVLGLSVAAVLRREGRRLWLGGVDLVDGSPGALPGTHPALHSAAALLGSAACMDAAWLPCPHPWTWCFSQNVQGCFLTSQLGDVGTKVV